MGDFCKTMPFGKFKGQPIVDCPKSYLRWLEENLKLKPFLAGAIAEALGKPYKRKPGKPVPSVEVIGRDYVKSDDTSCPFDCEEP